MIRHNNYYNMTIPGEPISKARARVGKYGNVYNSQKEIMFKLKTFVRLKSEGFEIIGKDIPIKFTVTCFIEAPKYKNKKFAKMIEDECLPCMNKKDWDNYGKMYSDVCSKILYTDDNQIYCGTCMKLYSNNPRTEIEIEY